VLNNTGTMRYPAVTLNGATYTEEGPPVPCPRYPSGQRRLVLA